MPKRSVITFIIALLLFSLAGTASGQLFSLGKDHLLGSSLFVGLIYTISTVLLFFIMRMKIHIAQLMAYTGLMYATYLLVFFITFFSAYASPVIAIVTAGSGAAASFWLANKFIIKLKYKFYKPLLYGSGAHIVGMAATMSQSGDYIAYPFLAPWVDSFFSFSLFFWQAIIGMLLYLTLTKPTAPVIETDIVKDNETLSRSTP